MAVTMSPGRSPERAGLRPGDLVTAIGARRIVKPSDFSSAVQLHRPGDRIEMRVTRGGGERVVAVELDGRRP